MYIQEEPPRPADPLATFDDDYATAVLHIAWDLHTQTKERTLLFGLVELLPTEVPPPFENDDEEKEPCLLRKTNHRIFLRRVVMPAREALRWYLDCRRGVGGLPDKPGEDPARKLLLSDLGEDPPWPNLLCVSGDNATPPFCPPWQENPRVHHLIPLSEPGIMKVWRDAEREKATDWLSDRLHFRFDEYPEYWGSVHLVAPNPVYRDLEMRSRPGMPLRGSLFLRFQPRAGQTVEGLSMICRPNSWMGPVDIRHIIVKARILRIESEARVTDVQDEVIDLKRGLLAQGSYAFPTGFNLQVNMVTSRVRVAGKTPEESFEVDRVDKGDKIVTNETERTPSARERMAEAQRQRMRKRHVDSRSQRWFSGAKVEATSVVRELIHPAKREVLLVDPYFGPNELTFALAVRQEGIPIQILSSVEMLKNRCEEEGQEKEQGEALLANLDRLGAEDRLNPMAIRVMTGDRPAIHDRFLLVDDRVWLLGSSLNEFGSRGTMLVSLPDPEAVRGHLRKAWDDAKDLRVWVDERKKAQVGT
ncbi:VPA1262 family N-terminal domain-containing protein [Polyangium jinanense]|uniref:Phospholipase D-like domain-containing protein n=1 Tax=Polyangium jinanense TaxID=2829994 RepID=A0A9X4AT47_9BACT|nr:VPA1262 family N-terminal domain-containing protein [Polyangium jinanense]MDC3959978.1 hypothetical protein [Polyangium jinanense]MDC3983858.1 hypothetical protein [Polyangium jinanense]